MQKIIVVVILAFSLGGCITTTSGVLPMGPDTYSVSSDSQNSSIAKKTALSQAQSFCLNLGRELLVTNTKTEEHSARYTYDVTFLCLPKGDPQLTRPTYTKEPDVVIEDKRAK